MFFGYDYDVIFNFILPVTLELNHYIPSERGYNWNWFNVYQDCCRVSFHITQPQAFQRQAFHQKINAVWDTPYKAEFSNFNSLLHVAGSPDHNLFKTYTIYVLI